MRRVAVSLLLCLLGACEPIVPQGRFACATDEDCPDEMVCRSSRGRCYATEDDAGADVDAGPSIDGGAQTSEDGGASAMGDSGALDASTDTGGDASDALAADASTGAP